MSELLELNGVVLSSAPVRDFDKRLVVLTKERGKLTVWAPGAKRPGSSLMASTRNFVFGRFQLKEGRTGYQLRGIEVSEYFEDLALDLVSACYGSYILEFASYVAQENMEAGALLQLVYLALRAIMKPNLPNELVRRVYELKMLKLEGEYTQEPHFPCSPACAYAWDFVLKTPVGKLFTFNLSGEVLREFAENVDYNLGLFAPWNFKSLDILKTLG